MAKTVIQDVFLILTVLLLFALGAFLTLRLDVFLNVNRKSLESDAEPNEPSTVMLGDGLSDEEIADEIRRFRKTHGKVTVVLSDKSQKDDSKNNESSEEKQLKI